MPVRAPRVTLVPSILVPSHQEGVTDVTPWLRPLRVTGLLLVLLAGPAPMPTPAPTSPPYEPAPGESRAGSRAGRGPRAAGPASRADGGGERGGKRKRTALDEAQEEGAGAGHPDGPADGEQSEGAVAPEPPGNTASASHPPVDAEQAAEPPGTRLGTRPAGPAARQRTGPHRPGPRPRVRRTARTAGLRGRDRGPPLPSVLRQREQHLPDVPALLQHPVRRGRVAHRQLAVDHRTYVTGGDQRPDVLPYGRDDRRLLPAGGPAARSR